MFDQAEFWKREREGGGLANTPEKGEANDPIRSVSSLNPCGTYDGEFQKSTQQCSRIPIEGKENEGEDDKNVRQVKY